MLWGTAQRVSLLGGVLLALLLITHGAFSGRLLAAVEFLVPFTVTPSDTAIQMTWVTASEYNVERFDIMCKEAQEPSSAYHVIDSVAAIGGVDQEAAYERTFPAGGFVPGQAYCFRLVEITTSNEPGDIFDRCGYGLSITPTPGLAPTITIPPTPTIMSPLGTPTADATATLLAALTVQTNVNASTATFTPTPTLTPTFTHTPSPTITPTPTGTAAAQSALEQPTVTASVSPELTATVTLTGTAGASGDTAQMTPTPTWTATLTGTLTSGAPLTGTTTITATPVMTGTPIASGTPGFTATGTLTTTGSLTNTGTLTGTLTGTVTPTITVTTTPTTSDGAQSQTGGAAELLSEEQIAQLQQGTPLPPYLVITATPTPPPAELSALYTPLPTVTPTPPLNLSRIMLPTTENILVMLLCFIFLSAGGLGVLGLITSGLYMRSRSRIDRDL